MSGLQKTEKVKTKHHTYRRTGCGAKNTHKFAGSYLQMVLHKNAPRALLIQDKYEKEFHTIQVISPTEARVIIGWLARYIALSDPDPISLAIASTRAHASAIKTQQDIVAKELGL